MGKVEAILTGLHNKQAARGTPGDPPVEYVPVALVFVYCSDLIYVPSCNSLFSFHPCSL